MVRPFICTSYLARGDRKARAELFREPSPSLVLHLVPDGTAPLEARIRPLQDGEREPPERALIPGERPPRPRPGRRPARRDAERRGRYEAEEPTPSRRPQSPVGHREMHIRR